MMTVKEYSNTKKQIYIRITNIDNSSLLHDLCNLYDACWIESLYRDTLEVLFSTYSDKIGKQLLEEKTHQIDIPYTILLKISPDVINHVLVEDLYETEDDIYLIIKD